MGQSYIIMVQKRKNVKKALEADIANDAVKQAQKEVFNRQNV